MPRRLTPVLLAIATVWLAPTAHAQIAEPSLTEINLVAVPFGQYLSYANSGNMPSCPSNETVQSCVQSALVRYKSAGVTGVRIMFGFCPNPSNPDDVEALTSCNPSQASVNQSWASNVDAFMGDVASAGIQRVTLSPIFWGWTMFSHPPSQTFSPDPCFGGTVTLYWEASAPFGQFIAGQNPDGSPIYYPWPQDFNNGYNCSPANPNFVGWQPLFNVVSTVIQKAYNHGLTVDELDVSQELDLFNFTVEGRLITDNKSGDEDLIWNLAYYMSNDSNNTYDSLRVTYSGTESRSTANQSPPYDCGSVYGIRRASRAFRGFTRALAVRSSGSLGR